MMSLLSFSLNSPRLNSRAAEVENTLWVSGSLFGKLTISPLVIATMLEDVLRESTGEIVDNPAARKAIGKRTVELFKERVQRIVDTRTGVVSTDVLAISAVGPGSLPLRATNAAGQFTFGQPIASFWYPLTKVGDPRPEAYTMPGLELLFQWEFKRR